MNFREHVKCRRLELSYQLLLVFASHTISAPLKIMRTKQKQGQTVHKTATKTGGKNKKQHTGSETKKHKERERYTYRHTNYKTVERRDI